MASEELLAILTPHGKSHFSVRGTSINTLKPTDIAHALGFVGNRGVYGLLLFLYVDDESLVAQVVNVVKIELLMRLGVSELNRWERYKIGAIDRLIEMRLEEMRSNEICGHCKGTGELLTKEKFIECKACMGTGRIQHTEVGRAKRFGVARSNWYSGWRVRYTQVCSILDTMHNDGLRRFKRVVG